MNDNDNTLDILKNRAKEWIRNNIKSDSNSLLTPIFEDENIKFDFNSKLVETDFFSQLRKILPNEFMDYVVINWADNKKWIKSIQLGDDSESKKVKEAILWYNKTINKASKCLINFGKELSANGGIKMTKSSELLNRAIETINRGLEKQNLILSSKFEENDCRFEEQSIKLKEQSEIIKEQGIKILEQNIKLTELTKLVAKLTKQCSMYSLEIKQLKKEIINLKNNQAC